MALEDLLQRVLDRLMNIGEQHQELYDSEVRERLGDAVMDGFVRAQGVKAVPIDLGMLSDDANRAVRAVIVAYIEDANAAAEPLAMSFFDRLNAVQNRNVKTRAKRDYETYFLHTPPECYDEKGNLIQYDR